MRIIVITGLNGSGKTTALRALEDLGFYAIDNLPIILLDKLVELFRANRGEIQKLALVADARGNRDLSQVPRALQDARDAGHDVALLFMDASDEVIARRYRETRRRHPMAAEGESVDEGIERERKLLEPLQHEATCVIDTTQLSVHDTKREVTKRFTPSEGGRAPMAISVLSFGFKHGAPSECDLVFDVRFLPNPYFVDALRPLTGHDAACAEYVLDRPETAEFVQRLMGLLEFLLPRYEHEGKVYLTIGIGCTGGRHRSVALANHLADLLGARGHDARARHRDTPLDATSPADRPSWSG